MKARRAYLAEQGFGTYRPPVLDYKAKIKLDGTNAAINVIDGVVHYQSRSQLITPEKDNAGFVRWAMESGFADVVLGLGEDVIVFGEWAGPGIQKRTAVSRLSSPIFAVFALEFPESAKNPRRRLVVEPEKVSSYLPQYKDVYVLPWEDYEVRIDYEDPAQLASAADILNQYVSDVEAKDPWVARTFGIAGMGEGLVFYLYKIYNELVGDLSRSAFETWAFKAKGEEHQVVRQKAPVIVDTELVANVDAFVEKFVTPQRLNQGAQECGGADMSNTSAFLKWVGQDVKSESVDELEAAGLTWKDVSKAVTSSARTWWIDFCRKA